MNRYSFGVRWMLRIVLAGVIVALAGFLGYFFLTEQREQSALEDAKVKMEKELRPLEIEKRGLRKELEDLLEDYQEESKGMGSVVLLFTDLNEQIYTEIYPKMESYGFTGVLTLSPEQLPGQTGCLSAEEFDELMEAGWECCLRWDADMEPAEWMIQSLSLAREAGITRPKLVYFPSGTYDAEQDAFLSGRGFEMAVHHGEGEQTLYETQSGTGLWHPGAVAWNQSGASARMEEAIKQGGNLVFTTGSDSEAEGYSADLYTSMLERLDKRSKAEELLVTGLTGARAYRRELEDGQQNRDKTYEEQKQQIEEQIETLDQERDEIVERYM